MDLTVLMEMKDTLLQDVYYYIGHIHFVVVVFMFSAA